MSMGHPLPKAEAGEFEIMDSDALDTPGIVTREVVARLNGSGGEIWVNVVGRDADREARVLANSIADTIEPSPAQGDITVESQAWAGRPVLRVIVRPSSRKGPFAYLESGGRHFLIMDKGHTRGMHRHEIFDGIEEGNQEIHAAIRMVLGEEQESRERLQRHREDDLYWLRLQPTRNLKLNLNEIEDSDLLLDPVESGNRRAGFVAIATLAGFGPRIVSKPSGKRALEVGREGNTYLRIFDDGGILFTAPLLDFWWPPRSKEEEPQNLLWPYAVLEYPVSVFRIASKIYAQRIGADDTALVSHMAVFNLRGWALRPGSPGRWGFRLPPAVTYRASEDFVLDKPLVIPLRDLEQPDSCGFRLVLRFYEAFGFSKTEIPIEFDQKVGRLVLPE